MVIFISIVFGFICVISEFEINLGVLVFGIRMVLIIRLVCLMVFLSL